MMFNADTRTAVNTEKNVVKDAPKMAPDSMCPQSCSSNECNSGKLINTTYLSILNRAQSCWFLGDEKAL